MSRHEKARQGGGGSLLDSFFGRPKTKGSQKHYGTNGGNRPVSADGEPPDFQQITVDISRQGAEEINEKFLELLDDMNIPKDKREPLLKKNIDEKRKMILIHLKGKQKRF